MNQLFREQLQQLRSDAVRRLAFFKSAIATSPALARRLIAATFPDGIVASPVERGKKRRFWLSGEASFGVLSGAITAGMPEDQPVSLTGRPRGEPTSRRFRSR